MAIAYFGVNNFLLNLYAIAMKIRILFLMLTTCLAWQMSFAQKLSEKSSNIFCSEPNETASSARYLPGTPSRPQPLLGACLTTDLIGSSSNVFTQILTEAHPVAVDDDLNSIVFVHRNNAGVFGGHSGNLRYDLSTNAGLTWTNNQGPLNPASVNGTNAARYPNVGIYNPVGNTNPSNAYLSYMAATVGSTWNGTVSGVRRLSGIGNTENYNQTAATQTFIPRGMAKGAPGVYWTIDAVWNGTAITAYRIYKGTWNGSNDITWAVNTTLTPTFNTLFDGSVKTSDFSIAFDPSGTYGWACLITHVTPGASGFTFYPVFYKTTNGGLTWSGPDQVDLMQFPCISSNIAPGNIATVAFDVSLTVDVNGNPHALMSVGNGNNAYAIFLGNWHAMVDLTISDGFWNPVIIRNLYRGRATWGTAPNTVTQDSEPQASRTADGTKVFFTWSDADSSVALATAEQSPNLYGAAYDVNTKLWTDVYDFTSCNATWAGKARFPKAAETVLTASGNYKVAVVFAEFGLNDDPINPANFHYMDSVYFTPSDFSIPQCSANVSIAITDTIVVCGSTTLDAGPGAQGYIWSTGATTQGINVTTSGLYSVSVSNGCCTGSDEVYVLIEVAPNANFSTSVNGFSASFSNASIGSNLGYLWDFGDGNTSTSPNPNHTYAGAGTYTVCLTINNICGNDSTCQTVVATCAPQSSTWTYSNSGLTTSFTDMTAGNPISWNWAFGDGQFSNLQNPVHTYSAPGLYTACLAITDACGSDTLCQLINACNLPNAAFGYSANLGTVTFNDQSSGGNAYLWDFGDGNTSTSQNPTNTYASSGIYTVCLTVSDSCGTDSTCQTVNVNVVAIEDSFGEAWEIYPNPTQGQIQIQAEGLDAGELKWELQNVLGQIQMSGTKIHYGGKYQQVFDLKELESGVYFISVCSEKGKIVRKIIKE